MAFASTLDGIIVPINAKGLLLTAGKVHYVYCTFFLLFHLNLSFNLNPVFRLVLMRVVYSFYKRSKKEVEETPTMSQSSSSGISCCKCQTHLIFTSVEDEVLVLEEKPQSAWNSNPISWQQFLMKTNLLHKNKRKKKHKTLFISTARWHQVSVWFEQVFYHPWTFCYLISRTSRKQFRRNFHK